MQGKLKPMFLSDLLMVLVAGVSVTGGTTASETRPEFRPLLDGVVELTGISVNGGIVELKDGSLMLAQGSSYCISTDGGKTWGEPQTLNCEVGAEGVIRLNSGALGLYGGGKGDWKFSSSIDDGKTWTMPVQIPTYPDFFAMHHSMIQLSSGRLLLVGYWEGLNATAPDAHRYTQTGWGLWRNLVLFMEGHRGVEMGICIVYYSDDDGQTWQQAEGGLFGWFDESGVPNGEGGIIDVYEPTAAETRDGRVLLFARSKTGRLVQSYSLNGGQTWQSIVPTELSSSQSPPILVKTPQTGDLLCVWNQVSAEEIKRGFLRGRLSVAISKDNGMTWENFKTLELQEGMEDVTRITPEYPIPRVTRGRPGLGQLPDGFAMFTYPNVDIVGDTVFIRYSRMWPKARETSTEASGPQALPRMWPDYEERGAEMTGEGVMRIYPIEWFYEYR